MYFKLDDDFYPGWADKLPEEFQDGVELGGIKISYKDEDGERSTPIAPIFSLFSEKHGSIELTQISTSVLVDKAKQSVFEQLPGIPEENLHFVSPEYVSGGKLVMRNPQRKRMFSLAPGVSAVQTGGNSDNPSSQTVDID